MGKGEALAAPTEEAALGCKEEGSRGGGGWEAEEGLGPLSLLCPPSMGVRKERSWISSQSLNLLKNGKVPQQSGYPEA